MSEQNKGFYEALKSWAESKRGDDEYTYQVQHFDLNDGKYERPDRKIDVWHTCGICGKPEDGVPLSQNRPTSYAVRKEMALCFTCAHWKSIDFSLPTPLVINGSLYSAASRKPHGTPGLGFGGQEFLIFSFNQSRFISTNNLWSGNKVPKRFAVPDNAEFINTKTTDDSLNFIKALYPEAFKDKQVIKHLENIQKEKEREEQRQKDIESGKCCSMGCPF